jgi:diaminopimelate epimerase
MLTHRLAITCRKRLYTRPMGVAFHKMNGLGNDFVVVDARARSLRLGAAAARRIGDRHRGVGFDQLLVIERGTGAGDFVMRIWNPDGSESGAFLTRRRPPR